MNGLEKSIHELINMLVQYEATTHKSEPAVLVGEASTSKAKGKGARRWKRKKGKGTAVTATASTEVLERSRKLSKDEMILRLGDGKAVAAEVVGSLSLVVSNRIRIDLKDYYFVPNNEILSQWTPPGTPQLNGVAERRNRTLLDMVWSMMSFTELPPSFWDYALETAAKLLNIAPSKSVPQTPYEIWHGKLASYKFIGYLKETVGYYFYDPAEEKIFVSRNAVFFKKDFPSDSRRDEVLIEESSEELQHDSTTSFEPTVHTDGVPVLRRSTRESRVPETYEFIGLTSQLDNDPKTYGEVMSDIDLDKWLEAIKFEMDSMGSKPSLDPRRPTQMRKACRMDMKTVFLNSFIEEEIFMDQPEGFTAVGEEQKVCRLQRSIYGLKQASRSWNTHFDEDIEKVLKRFKMEHSK
ncbi:UNVERIFIED_CONTAM: putative transposon Ty5-1 protein [Sesamum latifolium]|uniref:Transposon Ty5-1 protein n=1 Tax=Sesamum latifolium TaxID=2727402 RepID=A0AAW2WSK1_9LAMI